MAGNELNKEPAEGSRETIDHELARQMGEGDGRFEEPAEHNGEDRFDTPDLSSGRPDLFAVESGPGAIRLKPLARHVMVITGASSGIGLSTARKAAKAGARVMLAARDEEALSDICDEINDAGGVADYCRTDVSSEEDVAELARYTVEQFGGFDTWVNNAGVGLVATVDRTSSEHHHKIFETNYFGVVYGSLQAMRQFRAQGTPGALINLGSVVSDMPIPLSVAYSATKHAIKGFTDGLRLEVMQEKLPVSVTLIKPSAIDTRFFDHARSEMGGMGKAPGPHYAPGVVANAILYAAQHPVRHVPVGSTAHFSPMLERMAPQRVDRQQAAMQIEDMVDFGHQPAASSLDEVPEEGNERSRFGHGRRFSVTTSAGRHRGQLLALSLIAGGALLWSGMNRNRRPRLHA